MKHCTSKFKELLKHCQDALTQDDIGTFAIKALLAQEIANNLKDYVKLDIS